jgi:hypothetical protein
MGKRRLNMVTVEQSNDLLEEKVEQVVVYPKYAANNLEGIEGVYLTVITAAGEKKKLSFTHEQGRELIIGLADAGFQRFVEE